MCSAFKTGIELLSEPEPGSIQTQGKPVDSSSISASEHTEGIVGVPKNVAQLKPIINELLRKVMAISIRPVSANVM